MFFRVSNWGYVSRQVLGQYQRGLVVGYYFFDKNGVQEFVFQLQRGVDGWYGKNKLYFILGEFWVKISLLS